MITDANIREYLLGRLDSDSELVESIDDQILTDPKFSMSVDVVEDEIIEEYLEGSLSSEDKRAVEKLFLRPPERQHKLKTARLISRYFEAQTPKQPAPARSLYHAFELDGCCPVSELVSKSQLLSIHDFNLGFLEPALRSWISR